MSSHHNSLVAQTKTYYQTMFFDIKWLYGASQKEWERDLFHLLSVLEDHGMRLACIDLPAVAKHFDRCLDEGRFTPSRLPLTGMKSREVRVPKFLGHLYLKVFHKDGLLRDDASIEAIVAIRQLYMGLKKLKLSCNEESINVEIQNFLEIEPVLRHPTNKWDDVLPSFIRNLRFKPRGRTRNGAGRYAKEPSQDLSQRLDILHRVCDMAAAMFGDLHSEESSELPKHGPGVVSNLKRGEDKYSFPAWNDRLEAVFPYSQYAVANEGLLLTDSRDLSWAENSSRLICVPKTLKGPRLIAAESVENQWLQQLVRNQLESRLRRTPISHSIRFDSQEENQKKAIIGSDGGSLATIDLSSASDRLSCWVVERVFRVNPSILERLSAVRTLEVAGKLLKKPIRLRKHSTMGSAVTFTVQSIVYACMAIACVYDEKRVTIAGVKRASTRVQVFGDDIIIPSTRLHVLTEMLEYLQLKVNKDKTFGNVNFRESCGVDAFRGNDVTPVYVSHLNTGKVADGLVASMVQTSNNLHLGGYWRTAALFTVKEKANLLPILERTSGLFGYLSFSGRKEPAFKRWNQSLQRYEWKTLQPYKKAEHIQRDTHASLLQYFIEEPEPVYDWKSGYKKYGRVSLRVGWHPLYS